VISWNASRGAIWYILEEDSNKLFDSPVVIYEGSDLLRQVKNKPNGTYYYRLKAVGGQYISNWSNPVDITVDWPPDIPQNLQISVYPGGNTLNITWDLNLIDTEKYIIEFKNESMVDWEIKTLLHPTNTYNHTGLVDGEKYYYRIQAKDHHNQLSNFSEIISGIPQDSIPPQTPTGLTMVSTTYNSISLSWDPNIEDDLKGYHLFRSKKANPIDWNEPLVTIPKDTEEFIDADLDEETTYYYVISAFDEVPNESTYSGMVSGITTLGPHPPESNNAYIALFINFTMPEDTYDDSINLLDWFFDANGDQLRFRYSGEKHINVTIFQHNGTVILRPEKDWNGQETLTFYANDTIYETFGQIIITVTPVNDPPEVPKIIKPEDDIKINENETLNFEGACEDADLNYGDELTFKWSSNITGELGEGETLSDIVLELGVHQITLEVSDTEGAVSMAIITVSVLPISKPDKNDTIDNKDTQPEEVTEDNISIIIMGIIDVILVIIFAILLFMFLKKEKPSVANEKTMNNVDKGASEGADEGRTGGC
jgi:hypothetical protein